jgi:hypothetical protein
MCRVGTERLRADQNARDSVATHGQMPLRRLV